MSIIPGWSEAVASFRLSPGIDAYKLSKQWQKLTQSFGSDSVTITCVPKVVCSGFGTNESKDQFVVGLMGRLGFEPWQGLLLASLPVGEMIENDFNAAPQILSFGSSQDNAHGPDESISLEALASIGKVIQKLIGDEHCSVLTPDQFD